jgi:hypothetical protein
MIIFPIESQDLNIKTTLSKIYEYIHKNITCVYRLNTSLCNRENKRVLPMRSLALTKKHIGSVITHFSILICEET